MRRFVALVLVLPLLAAACGATSEADSTGRKPLVVATTTQVADFVRNIAGNEVDVYQVVKPNVDPHDYEASPADIDAFGRAKRVFSNGVGIEPWLSSVVRSSETKAPVVDTSRGVRIRRDRDGGKGSADPHIWQDPLNAKIMCENIEKSLAAIRGVDTEALRSNLTAYSNELDQLDADIGRQISGLRDRKLVTNHDAFRYYIDRYGLVFEGSIIPSFDTSAELSAKDVSDLVAKIKAQDVKAVFSESSLPPKTAEAIAKRAGVKVVAGKGALYGDSLGPKGSDGATYLKMLEHNTRTIVENLR